MESKPSRPSGRSRTAKSEPDPPMVGAVSLAVQAFLNTLDLADPRLAALAALALSTAAQLDAGVGMAHAAVSKELRATLEAIGGSEDGGDDDDAFARWEADLSHPS